jgi:hypothetical protein
MFLLGEGPRVLCGAKQDSGSTLRLSSNIARGGNASEGAVIGGRASKQRDV